MPANSFPGVTSVFRNLHDRGHCAALEADANYRAGGVPRWPEAAPGDVLLLGAWSPLYAPLLRRPGLKKYVLWTSAPLQTEMAGIEVEALDRIFAQVEQGRLHGVLFGDERLAAAYAPRCPGRVHPFAYPVNPVPEVVPTIENFERRASAVSMFYPQHPRKNTFAQALAVKMEQLRTGDPARVLTNFPPPVPLDGVACGGWLPRAGYLQVLRESRLNLHVTVTESFGYQVADALRQGVPSLVSETVGRNLFGYPYGHDQAEKAEAVIEDLEDPAQIADAIGRFLRKPSRLQRLWEVQRDALGETAHANDESLKILLRRLIETP